MDIMLIGNGFDLAHGLPTTYTNFLHFLKKIHSHDTSSLQLLPELECLLTNTSTKEDIERIKELCQGNIWFNYFDSVSNMNQNWCDFESEIEFIVNKLELLEKELQVSRTMHLTHNDIVAPINTFLYTTFKTYIFKNTPNCTPNNLKLKIDYTYDIILHNINYGGKLQLVQAYLDKEIDEYKISISFPKFINFVLKQLNDFTKCFEIYLSSFINPLKCKKIGFINDLLMNHNIKIITFNYTSTFLIYNYSINNDCCYIHGIATKDNTDNIVLGIDEKSNNISPLFAPFRKYFQRAAKKCHINFRRWIMEINLQNKHTSLITNKEHGDHHLYIIGHSLTPSDRGILNEIITLEGMKTTVYYYSEANRMNLMQNLAAILGYENFSTLMESNLIEFEEGSFNKTIIQVKP